MDREKLIEQLENEAIATDKGYVEIPLFMFSEIIALLKQQEAVKPQLSMSGLWYECPICHRHLLKDRDNYCARCGRRLKWE